MVNENLAIADEDMTEKFHVIYDGEALDEHLMDVRDLAPAMMAISDLLTHANQVINGDKVKIQLKVKANFKAGSFGLEFVEYMTWANHIKDFLLGPGATAISNASGILSFIGFFSSTTFGLIQLYKYLKGKPPVKVEVSDSKAKVFYTETEYVEIDERTLKLYRNRTIAADLEKVLEPLTKDGIDTLYVVKDDNKKEPELVIQKQDIEYFKYQEVQEDENVTYSQAFVTIVSVTFKEKNKWKFSNGNLIFSAKVTDEYYLNRINSGELRFGKGDILKVKLKSTQTIAHNTLKTEYEVVEVLEHQVVKNDQEKFDLE